MAEDPKNLQTPPKDNANPGDQARVLQTAKAAFEKETGRKFDKYKVLDQKRMSVLVEATRSVSEDGRADVDKVINKANSTPKAGGSLMDALAKAVDGDNMFFDFDDEEQGEPQSTKDDTEDETKTEAPKQEVDSSFPENQTNTDESIPKPTATEPKPEPLDPSKLPKLGKDDGLKFGDTKEKSTDLQKPNQSKLPNSPDSFAKDVSGGAGKPPIKAPPVAQKMPGGAEALAKSGAANTASKQLSGVDINQVSAGTEALAQGNLKEGGKKLAQAGASAALTEGMDALIMSGIGLLVIIGLAPLFLIAYLICRLLGVKIPGWQGFVIFLCNIVFGIIVLILFLTVFEYYCNPTGYGFIDRAINTVQDYATDTTFCKDYNAFRNSQLGNLFNNENPQLSSYSGPISVGQWKDTINTYSEQYKIDSCVLYTIVAKESKGSANAVGHDNHSSKDDPLQPNNPPFFGLSMPARSNRSHGIGLTQITIFPEYSTQGGANWPAWPVVNGVSVPARWAYTIPEPNAPRGKYYTIGELLDPNTSIRLAAAKMSSHLRGSVNDVRSAFRAYNGGGQAAENYANDAMRIYNDCKSGNTK